MSLNFDTMNVKIAHKVFMALISHGKTLIYPVCERHAQKYKRRINKNMARGLTLIDMDFAIGEWFHLSDWATQRRCLPGNDGALLRHWGLLESRKTNVRRSNAADPDDPDHGWYCLTELGHQWANGLMRLPEYLLQYNQQAEVWGPLIYIHEVNRFDYNDLPLDAPIRTQP